MTSTQLQILLQALLTLEHRTKESLSADEYGAMVALAQACEAPSFITEYFARKATTAN